MLNKNGIRRNACPRRRITNLLLHNSFPLNSLALLYSPVNSDCEINQDQQAYGHYVFHQAACVLLVGGLAVVG
jgi:hypothetical protein